MIVNMLVAVKIFIYSAIVLSVASLTFCQSEQVRQTTRKHTRHSHVQVATRQPRERQEPNHPPQPTPASSPDKVAQVTLASYPYSHESYLVHPDGRWEWIPPGPSQLPVVEQPKPKPQPKHKSGASF